MLVENVIQFSTVWPICLPYVFVCVMDFRYGGFILTSQKDHLNTMDQQLLLKVNKNVK